MKVAAFQAPLGLATSEAIAAIREQVNTCEAQDVAILCCPEAILGGLADYVDDPHSVAINVASGELEETLLPLASPTVTTILGFTETDASGRLFNSAVVFHSAGVLGLYRKLYPAIKTSNYQAGRDLPTFTVGTLNFGILICRDSTYPAPARRLAGQGANAIFIPTNNGMPAHKGGPELVSEARELDVLLATQLRLAVIRADVAGQVGRLESHGATCIIDRTGTVLVTARPGQTDLVIANIETSRA